MSSWFPIYQGFFPHHHHDLFRLAKKKSPPNTPNISSWKGACGWGGGRRREKEVGWWIPSQSFYSQSEGRLVVKAGEMTLGTGDNEIVVKGGGGEVTVKGRKVMVKGALNMWSLKGFFFFFFFFYFYYFIILFYFLFHGKEFQFSYPCLISLSPIFILEEEDLGQIDFKALFRSCFLQEVYFFP